MNALERKKHNLWDKVLEASPLLGLEDMVLEVPEDEAQSQSRDPLLDIMDADTAAELACPSQHLL